MNNTIILNRLNDLEISEMRDANPTRRTRRGTANSSRRISVLLLLAAILASTLPSMAQTNYVFYNETVGYLYNNNNALGVKTDFDPACIWTASGTLGTTARTIESYTVNGRYLYTNGTVQNNNGVSLNTTSSNLWRMDNNYLDIYANNRNYYFNYTGSGFNISRNGYTNRFTPYEVTITPVAATITNPTISGADVLTATGTSNYSAPGAAYRAGGYTNYYFNSTNHYFDANGNSITPANATIGAATWSLSDNAYATVNASTGVVTVSSLSTSDIELTLTVTYPVTAGTGTPAAPSGVTLTATKTITLQGTIPSAPTITVSGTTVTMATDAAGTTTIRYTLDGSDPTTSTGTVYNGPIDVSGQTTSPVVIKAITVRNGNKSSVTEQSVQLTLPAPVITADASAGTATISCANDSATIYYTTDGTTPSATNGTAYTSSLSGLPLMTNLQAIAVRDGWNDSPVASTTLTLPSGTDGTTVTLFDYEPHSWSYYNDADCPIRSLNPADVKITYYGDGIMMMNNNNYTASSVVNTDYITSSGTNYTGGAKVNVGGEDENTFIYYKTLERGDATETAWTYSSSNQTSAASRCPYTTIPNPFQVRPTYGTTGNARWRGFQCWRLKSVSGGAVYSAASDGTALTVGAVIDAETEIYFAPNAETGMTVDFEAVWARAYVVTSGTNGANNIGSNDVGYERNFIVLTTSNAYRFGGDNDRRISNTGYAATVSRYYPDGTIGVNNSSASVRGGTAQGYWAQSYYGLVLSANTKFENVAFSDLSGDNYYISANNHDLIIGRGCTGTVNIVRGMGGNTSEALDYTIRLESGVFNYVAFIAGIAGGTASGEMTLSGTNNHVTGVLGCDYDRAVEKSTTNYNYTTAPLRVTNSMSLGAQPKLTNQTESEIFNVTVKSGYFGSGNSISDGGAARSFYIGLANEYNTGKRKLTIEGGRFNLSIAGGIDVGNTSDNAVIVRMKGGEVAGSIYGAAAHAAATGGRRFIFTGGTVGGWIAGGCNGTQTTGGKLDGKTFIYFGGTAQCNSNGSNTTIGPGNATGGNIFGAGSGNASSGPTATVGEVDQSTIVIADQSMVERNVYGGGNYGYVAGTGNTNKSDIYILGGDVKGSVFGGANMQKGNIVNITMKDGLVENGIYGGSNTRGDIAGNVTIQVDGGTVGQGNAGNGIFGGGYGQTTRVNGDVSVTLGTCTAGDVTVFGDVYGGSALGTVNNAASDKTTVSLYNGTIRGGLYGGGYGPGGVAANVNGAVEVKVFGGSVLCSESDPQGEAGSGSVFGCNNAGGAPQSTVTVDIYNTDQPASGYALHAVYGGGNKAAYNNTPVVTIHGCNNSIEYVYGGGNATDVRGTNVTIWGGTIGNAFAGGNGAGAGNPGANITADGTTLVIHGGTIGSVFGGSNEKGKISSSVSVTVVADVEDDEDPCTRDAYTQCPMEINEMYSGGNEAELRDMEGHWIAPGNINVTTHCSTVINYLFGGARKADYGGGDITLNVNGGRYKKIFGGNNLYGEINGNVTVNFYGGYTEEIYGGNNQGGTVLGTITVNIDSSENACTPHFYVENVYGGGNEAPYSHASGNYPEVNVINGTVQENVYGGGYGSSATVTGSPAVTVGVSNTEKRALVLGNVFGGGNAAPVSGNTDVKILYNSYIKGNVYGGGNKATVSGNTKVNIGN